MKKNCYTSFCFLLISMIGAVEESFEEKNEALLLAERAVDHHREEREKPTLFDMNQEEVEEASHSETQKKCIKLIEEEPGV